MSWSGQTDVIGNPIAANASVKSEGSAVINVPKAATEPVALRTGNERTTSDAQAYAVLDTRLDD